MVPWVACEELDISLDHPLETRYAHVPDRVFDSGRELLEAIMREFPAGSLLLADAVRLRTRGRFHAEACHLARRVQRSWREVMLANVSYDLALAVMGCSTVALPTPDGPVVARNMDWWPERILARTSCLVRYHKADGLAYANAGWPGAIGVVTGMNGTGFAVVLNAVLCPGGTSKTGYPVLLHLRRTLEDARDFNSAVDMLSREKLAAPCLLTVVGSRNDQRVVIERTPMRAAQRWANADRPLVATNDYRMMYAPRNSDAGEIYETTCNRYSALTAFFAGHTPDRPVSDEELLYILTTDTVMQSITAQHVIMRPAAGTISVYVPRHLVG